MTMKPFEIQGAQLKLGGVQLEAGTTGVVIPGLSQAVNYKVDEVNDLGRVAYQGRMAWQDGMVPEIIDFELFSRLAGYVDRGADGYIPPTYIAILEDSLPERAPTIDKIEVDFEGVIPPGDAVTNTQDGMFWAFPGESHDINNPGSFVASNWTREGGLFAKCEPGEVENIGGSGGGATSLVDLEDVNLEGPVEGSVLTWDATDEKWVNRTPSNNADTGNMTFSGDTITGSDGVARMRTLSTQQTAYYSFTPGVDYSTAVWDGTGITFNDPTQTVYDAIWALTDVSGIEVQVAGDWFTVTSVGSSTPGMPQAPTLWLNETAVGGPLNIDIVDITIYQGTESYVEIDGTDFRVDVQDDIRMYANDAFRLINRSTDASIEIQTNDGTHVWEFLPDGNVTIPSNGDILRDGTSVLFSGTSLPSDASGYLNNDGSGTLTWVPGNPSGSGVLPYNGVTVFSNTIVGDWTSYTLSGTMDAFYDWNNNYTTITLSSEPAYGKQITPNTKTLWINDAKIDNKDYIVIEFPASPTVGDVFTVPMVSMSTTVNAGSFVIGETYTIASPGTTDWMSIGAQYGGQGQSFVATGIGSGTGTAMAVTGAKKVVFKPASGQRAQTMAQGSLTPIVFGQGGTYDFMYIDLAGMNSGNPVTWVYAGVINSIPTWYQFYF